VAFRRVGLVVHPTRELDRVLQDIAAWGSEHGVEVGQVYVEGQTRRVADRIEPADCDLLVAVGGDGTTLAALHEAAPHSRPVLGIACGSVGMLTSMAADHVGGALDQIAAGQWTAVDVPGLEVGCDGAPPEMAINDLAVLRNGPGQAIVSVVVDDELYARVAGDGLVVATALGSSAYSMAAGGPLLAPGAEGMVITPLAAHGGCVPPLVTGRHSRLTLTVDAGFGGVRYDVDGRHTRMGGRVLTVENRPAHATLVELGGEEPRFAALRRRKLVIDSPRVLIRDLRPEPHPGPAAPPQP
jgi:NAD+ kinase